MENKVQKDFLTLVRMGIGTGTVSGSWFQNPIDWQGVKDLAENQGLGAVVLDGIEKLPEGQRPPKVFLLEWIGETLQGYEYRYEQYCRTIAEMAAFYNEHGFKMMVLKGYACGLDWPKPEHRPSGDIDIWQFGQQKKADAVLAKEKGIEIDRSHHHHTIFYWRDFMVENHYDFISVLHHKSHVELERILKSLAEDDSYSLVLYGEKLYLPSPNLHALFLFKHLLLHFVTGGISLRQVIDWAFFIRKHEKEIDWTWLLSTFDKFGMRQMFNIFNAICVEDLGFDASVFHEVQFDPVLKDRVLNEVLHPDVSFDEPKELFGRLLFKYRRWKGNEWKHKLCYKESMWSAFWSGVWAHLLKPKSI